ncbi:MULTISPECIES: hypothetical protein [Actinosynnema]|uniref:hypothetical protein n=1 Tax=Actinosynnema TaxID=40566 RepID=UPI0020A4478F|nr:hypothetical protein [Actinosynnema pretiosum]MCP2096601.1 hypothetical protein [Actinosynnema pretiosum]
MTTTLNNVADGPPLVGDGARPGRDAFTRRFPLIAQRRPACTPLAPRVAELCGQAREAARTGVAADVAAAHNQAALIASDCGAPDLAARWCLRQLELGLRPHPLDAASARLALAPVTNLARLHLRADEGAAAFALLDGLVTAVETGAPADVLGVGLPADLLDSPRTRREVVEWLRRNLRTIAVRAHVAEGRWTEAHEWLAARGPLGARMLEDRQVAVLARAERGDADGALALLAATAPGERWEAAVTACLTARHLPGTRVPPLDVTEPGLAVFHTRLGLSTIDVDDRAAAEVTARLLVIATRDGYAAREVLAHERAREHLTARQVHELSALVGECGLDAGAVPPALLADLTSALAGAEHVLASHRGDPLPLAQP